MKPLSFIIITYNRPADMLALLKNISTLDDLNNLVEEIIVVNNASKSYTAGSAVTANDALYLDGYQSDGGVKFDTKVSGNATSDGSGNATVTTPITVGSNSNRILLLFLFVNSATASGATASWSGAAMTQIDTVQMPTGVLGGRDTKAMHGSCSARTFRCIARARTSIRLR